MLGESLGSRYSETSKYRTLLVLFPLFGGVCSSEVSVSGGFIVLYHFL